MIRKNIEVLVVLLFVTGGLFANAEPTSAETINIDNTPDWTQQYSKDVLFSIASEAPSNFDIPDETESRAQHPYRAIPEPVSITMLGAGLFGMYIGRRRMRKNRK